MAACIGQASSRNYYWSCLNVISDAFKAPVLNWWFCQDCRLVVWAERHTQSPLRYYAKNKGIERFPRKLLSRKVFKHVINRFKKTCSVKMEWSKWHEKKPVTENEENIEKVRNLVTNHVGMSINQISIETNLSKSSGESSPRPLRTSWRLWTPFWPPWTRLRSGEPWEPWGSGLRYASKWGAAISSPNWRNTREDQFRSKNILTAWSNDAIDTFVIVENWILMKLLKIESIH